MPTEIKGLSDVRSYLNQLKKEEIPKAFRKVINNTLNEIKPREQAEIKSVFKNPTPYAVNSLWIAYATAGNDNAGSIRIKDNRTGGSGVPAVNFLGPNVIGGSRHHKSHEVQLIKKGIISVSQFIVPGKDAKLDRYGNQSRAEINAILSALGGAPVKGGWKYFLSRDRKTVFKAKGMILKVLWHIINGINYKQRLDYFGAGIDEANKKMLEHAGAAVESAINRRG